MKRWLLSQSTTVAGPLGVAVADSEARSTVMPARPSTTSPGTLRTSLVAEDDTTPGGKPSITLTYKGPAEDFASKEAIKALDARILGELARGPLGAVELRAAVKAKRETVKARCEALRAAGLITVNEAGKWCLVVAQ